MTKIHCEVVCTVCVLILIIHIVLNDFHFESKRGELKGVTAVFFEVVYS